MSIRRFLILLMVVGLPLIVTSCNSMKYVGFHHNGVTNNMNVVGPVTIDERDKRIFQGDRGVRMALIEEARVRYNTRIDNVVDIEESFINGKRVFGGIAVTYK